MQPETTWQELDPATLEQRVLQAESPMIVLITAEQAACPLVKLLGEEVAPFRGRFEVFRLTPEGAALFPALSTLAPAAGLALFSGGELLYRYTGEVSRAELEDVVLRARAAELLAGSGVALPPK